MRVAAPAFEVFAVEKDLLASAGGRKREQDWEEEKKETVFHEDRIDWFEVENLQKFAGAWRDGEMVAVVFKGELNFGIESRAEIIGLEDIFFFAGGEESTVADQKNV